MTDKFEPENHFLNLKGKQYLEVKWRVVWFREDHPDGYIVSEVVEHDAKEGLACFKAEVGYFNKDGFKVYAIDYGSETRADFAAGYYEKASTKAIGRALAMLGYGTAQAIELDEGESLADAPVQSRREAKNQATPKPLTAPLPPDIDAQLVALLAFDEEAATAMNKAGQKVETMSGAQKGAALSRLLRRKEERESAPVDKLPE